MTIRNPKYFDEVPLCMRRASYVAFEMHETCKESRSFGGSLAIKTWPDNDSFNRRGKDGPKL